MGSHTSEMLPTGLHWQAEHPRGLEGWRLVVPFLHWSQRMPITFALQRHWPVFMLQVSTPSNVPSVLQLHGEQPSGLLAERPKKLSRHVSHFSPITLLLQKHCPMISPPTPSFCVQLPSSVIPLGLQLQGTQGEGSVGRWSKGRKKPERQIAQLGPAAGERGRERECKPEIAY